MPADLTKLSEANKGVFPFSRTYEIIDGRFEVETHGKRDMPVWGEIYKPTWGSRQSGIPPYVSKELAALDCARSYSSAHRVHLDFARQVGRSKNPVPIRN